jgi:hypothetical protein
VQLFLNFLTPPQPATPLDRLDPKQRAELVRALARIITKAAGRGESPNKETATTSPTKGNPHD